MEVVLDGISPPGFGGAAFASFPAMDIWVKVIDFSYKGGELLSNKHFARWPYWISKWPPPKSIFNKSIFSLTHTIVGISRVIAFEYCFV